MKIQRATMSVAPSLVRRERIALALIVAVVGLSPAAPSCGGNVDHDGTSGEGGAGGSHPGPAGGDAGGSPSLPDASQDAYSDSVDAGGSTGGGDALDASDEGAKADGDVADADAGSDGAISCLAPPSSFSIANCKACQGKDYGPCLCASEAAACAAHAGCACLTDCAWWNCPAMPGAERASCVRKCFYSKAWNPGTAGGADEFLGYEQCLHCQHCAAACNTETYCSALEQASNGSMDLAVGPTHSCAIKQDGSLWCWGSNSAGQLGNGTNVDSSTPVQVMALGTTVKSVAAGDRHTCAIQSGGALWCWGHNEHHELFKETTEDSNVPLPAGSSVVAVSARHHHLCAVKTGGTLLCWGDNSTGQLGSPAPPQVFWNDISALGSGVTSVSTGESHTCARKDDGTVWCWGSGEHGELGNGATFPVVATPVKLGLTNMLSVSAGKWFTCSLKIDGTLWCWGSNSIGQLAYNPATAMFTKPQQIPVVFEPADSVGAGSSHACARKAVDNILFCWGQNDQGQLGIGSTTTPAWPAPVAATIDVAPIEHAAGTTHSCGRDSSGKVWCWGSNLYGQLGTGSSITGSTSPVPVSGTWP